MPHIETSPHNSAKLQIRVLTHSIPTQLNCQSVGAMQPQYTPPPHDLSPVPLRMLVESGAAIFTAVSIAPAVAIVDKAIVSNASGRQALLPCIASELKVLMSNPLQFVKQPNFLLIWGVYRCVHPSINRLSFNALCNPLTCSGTYIVANCIQAHCDRTQQDAMYPKFVGSSCTNVTLSVLKDRAFARLYGVGQHRPVPVGSFGLFAARDSMTVLASFTLPPAVSHSLLQPLGLSKFAADTLAQLLTPVCMQVMSTPLHLVGLDLYNRPQATLAERSNFLAREYLKTTAARMARILPAFGLGGVVNKGVRAEGLDYLRRSYPAPT
jgi:hypothetical protein